MFSADLSSSVTPPEIGEGDGTREMPEAVANGGDVMMPSASASNPVSESSKTLLERSLLNDL